MSPWPRCRSKFNAKPVTDGGLRFDSTAEFKRWCELKLLEKAGQIKALEHHPKFPLSVNGTLVCTYEADAGYLERTERTIDHWLAVIEDTKGGTATQTPEFKIKARLMLACHGIVVRLVGKGVVQRAP